MQQLNRGHLIQCGRRNYSLGNGVTALSAEEVPCYRIATLSCTDRRREAPRLEVKYLLKLI